ncbi:hypothetical protein GRJ2_000841800 [Grus japonensis]|uniref:Uncharacterized protein n=1 Tax=Grus japonensis TaxID=30415 RepID=A0ABC9WF34_GRUJA
MSFHRCSPGRDDANVWDLGTLPGEQEGWVRYIHQCLRWKPKSLLFLSFGITHNAVVWSLCKGRTDTGGLPPCGQD